MHERRPTGAADGTPGDGTTESEGNDGTGGQVLVNDLSRLLAELLVLLLAYVILVSVLAFIIPTSESYYYAIVHVVPVALILAYGLARRYLLLSGRKVSSQGAPREAPAKSQLPAPIGAHSRPRNSLSPGSELLPAADLRYLMDVFAQLDDEARNSLIGEANRLREKEQPGNEG